MIAIAKKMNKAIESAFACAATCAIWAGLVAVYVGLGYVGYVVLMVIYHSIKG